MSCASQPVALSVGRFVRLSLCVCHIQSTGLVFYAPHPLFTFYRLEKKPELYCLVLEAYDVLATTVTIKFKEVAPSLLTLSIVRGRGLFWMYPGE